MPLIVVVAGRYSGTWSGADVGIATDQGYVLTYVTHGEVVNRTDAYAQTTIEGIYQGADFSLQFVSKEYKTGSVRPSWPWGNDGSTLGFRLGVIGRRWTDVAQAMVLTSTAGTPAAAAPTSLTASLTIVSPNSNTDLSFTSKVREVPVKLTLIPDLVSSNVIWYSVT